MWQMLLFGFSFLCVAVPASPQSIGAQISNTELAEIEQIVLENVRPAIISLTNHVMGKFTHSIEDQIQNLFERETSIATNNEVHKLQTAVTSNKEDLLELKDQCRARTNSTSEITTSISTLGQKVQSNENNIQEISGTLHALNNEFGLYKQHTSHQREISIATNNEVRKLQTTVASNKEDLIELKEQCRRGTNSKSEITNNISNLGQRVEGNKMNIQEISGTLRDLNNDFERYKQQAAQQRGISIAINNEVRKIQTVVTSNKQELIELSDQCCSGNNSTSEVIKDISKLPKQIINNQNNIQEIKGTLNNLKSEFLAHKQETSLLSRQITSLQNEIRSLLKCIGRKGSVKGNFCFSFSSDSVTWAQARQNCRQMGGYLAIVNSWSITNFLNAMTVPGNDDFWIGGHDKRWEGSWIWDETGEPIRYTNWDKNEPNDADGEEDCLTLKKEKQGKWNDLGCHNSRKYICQIALQ